MGLELLLDMAVEAMPDRVLLGSASSGLTAAALGARAHAGARRLVEDGARSVAYLGVNGPGLPISLFASIRAGIQFTPLNYRLAPEAVRDQISSLPTPFVVADERYHAAVGRGVRVVDTDDWLATTAAGGATSDAPATDGAEVAVTLFTSGTTSAPKQVMLRHDHLLSYVLGTVEFASAEADDATLVSVPPYHVAGVGTVLTNLYAGRRLVYLPDFTAEGWVDSVNRERVRRAMVVPTMLARLVEHLEERPDAVPTLRAIAYGGARVPRPILERGLAVLPDVDFTNAYGLTETSSTIAVLTPEDHRAATASDDAAARERLASAGRMVPGVEAVIRDAEGAPVETGTPGALWVRGPQISGEYVGRGAVLDGDGWFPTNDLAHLDAEGYLFIHGRADDTIIRGGENIAPAEVEDVLIQHPDVTDVGVVGVPDDEWGQVIYAALVLRPGVAPDAEAVRAWARERLRGSRTPDRIGFCDALPYSPTGKLLRTELPAIAATLGGAGQSFPANSPRA